MIYKILILMSLTVFITSCTGNNKVFNKDGTIHFSSNNPQELYQFKNNSDKVIVIDYPPAHIGASAWVTQFVKPNSVIYYHYIKNKNSLATNNGRKNPNWKCNFIGNNKLINCEQYLILESLNIKKVPTTFKNNSFWLESLN